jgi:mannose-6-phosphate isomerase-like protein (cupin superfamily)
MRTRLALVSGPVLIIATFFLGVQIGRAQEATVAPPPTLGNHDSPLRPLSGDGNTGISNAVMRDQQDVRVLRVVVEPGGTRALHAHADVRFHLFVPISGPMAMTVDGADPVVVPPWQPFYMKAGTRHSFRNPGSSPVEIMEIFVKS